MTTPPPSKMLSAMPRPPKTLTFEFESRISEHTWDLLEKDFAYFKELGFFSETTPLPEFILWCLRGWLRTQGKLNKALTAGTCQSCLDGLVKQRNDKKRQSRPRPVVRRDPGSCR